MFKNRMKENFLAMFEEKKKHFFISHAMLTHCTKTNE